MFYMTCQGYMEPLEKRFAKSTAQAPPSYYPVDQDHAYQDYLISSSWSN